MKLRQATLLAAIGSAVTLAFSLEDSAYIFRLSRIPNPKIPQNDLLMMLPELFAVASLTLMLFMIYSELAGRKPWLSAAVGFGLWTLWSIYEPFAGSSVHWIGIACLRFGWAVLCAMIATANPRMGQVALVLTVLPAASSPGLKCVFEFRNV